MTVTIETKPSPKAQLFKKLKAVTKMMNVAKTGKNSYMNYDYYTLDNILDALEDACAEIDLHIQQSILTETTPSGALITEVVTMAYDLETGEEAQLGSLKFEMLKDPQKSGACITYYRRYALATALRIKGEKDLDGLTQNEFKTGQKDPNLLRPQNISPIQQLTELLQSNLTDAQHTKVEQMKQVAKQKYNVDRFSDLAEGQILQIITAIKNA